MCKEAPVAFLWAQPFTYVLSNRIKWTPRGDEWIRATDMRAALSIVAAIVVKRYSSRASRSVGRRLGHRDDRVFRDAASAGIPRCCCCPTGASEAQLVELRTALGLDRPLLTQYAALPWRGRARRFRPIVPADAAGDRVVLERLPATAQLASAALLVGVLLGVLTGFLAAKYRGTMIEFVAMVLALVGQATPVFWLGLMLIMLFAVDLAGCPPAATAGGRTWSCRR